MNPSTDFVPFALPSLGKEEEGAVLEVLRSGWLTTGKVARAFEAEFAAFVGADRALAVNSATSGLHLALEALGVGPGDVVVTSPYTFTSTAAVVRHLGAEVLFCDVGVDDFNLDPAALSQALERGKRVKAVIPVHFGGLPCKMDEILALCGARGIPVVEDAAHAFPSRTARGFAGTLGTIGVYSFYATKTITTGEGGMIVTSDEKLAARMATMRLHGFDREAWDRYTSKKAAWYYEVVEAGYKYNLPDLLAAIGREQLKKADSLLAERRRMAAVYDEAFSRTPGLTIPPKGEGHAWHLYSLRVAKEGIEGGRDSLIEWLGAAGIGTSVHFIPLHIMPYWAGRYSLKPKDFPRALEKFRATLSLPLWPGLSDEAQKRVTEATLAWAAREAVRAE
jgi:dTDP-4-amino-4,6-dideoxygalactose transaminase